MSALVEVCKSFAPGTLDSSEAIVHGVVGTVALVTTVALGILGAPAIAVGVVGCFAGYLLMGSILQSKGLTYSGYIIAAGFALAAAIINPIPLSFVWVI